jgi:dihydroorotase
MRHLAPLLLAVAASAQQHDLLIKGAHVIDPKNNVNAVMDVAIRGGRCRRSPPTLLGRRLARLSTRRVFISHQG